MSAHLSRNNNRFQTVRSQSGALHLDSVPAGPTQWDELETFDSGGADKVVFYWGATTASGTVSVTLYVRDGDNYIKGPTATGLAPNMLQELSCYGVSEALLLFTLVSGGGGTDAYINAIAMSN